MKKESSQHLEGPLNDIIIRRHRAPQEEPKSLALVFLGSVDETRLAAFTALVGNGECHRHSLRATPGLAVFFNVARKSG